MGPFNLEKFFLVFARLGTGEKVHVLVIARGRPPGSPARPQVDAPTAGRPTGQGTVPPAWACRSRNPKGAKNEAAEEGAAPTNASIHDDVLVLLQLGPVIFDVTRTVFNLRTHNTDIAPAEIGLVDVVGLEVAKHLAPPSQSLVGLVPVDDHAQTPNAQALEGRIQFAGEVGLFIVKVAFDGIDRGRHVLLHLGVGLRHRNGMLEGNGQSQAVENPARRFPAGFADLLVNLHGLPIAGGSVSLADPLGLGSVCDQHPL